MTRERGELDLNCIERLGAHHDVGIKKEKDRVIEDERKLNAIVENEGATQPGGGEESGHS